MPAVDSLNMDFKIERGEKGRPLLTVGGGKRTDDKNFHLTYLPGNAEKKYRRDG